MTAPLASAGPPQWTIQTTTNPLGTSGDNVLAGVSCPSATDCLAVGFTQVGHIAQTAIAESWNGTSWTTTPSAAPPGAVRSDLDAVSCASATACTAVGFYRDSGGTQHVLAEGWNGTSWTNESARDPAGTQAVLAGVSCVSASNCEAVGSYWIQSKPDYTDLAEVWNGQTWTIQPTHAAFSTMHFELNSVSCSSASFCLAVGDYVSLFGSAPYRATWAERWNGSSWSGLLPDVEGAASELAGVSCTTATTDCTAVGWYQDASGTEFPLAERWSGTTWSLQFPAYSALAADMVLTGVSCPTTTACMAVGTTNVPVTGPGTWLTVAQSWNGSSWTLDNTPNPLGAAESSLLAVSCPAAALCTGVGWSQSTSAAGPPVSTLAERYS
jgi:hypothetical protein